MPDRRRSSSLRPPLLTVVLALALALGGTAVARAGGDPAAGATVSGRLVHAYTEHRDARAAIADGDAAPLSWIQPATGSAVRVPTDAVAGIAAGSTVKVRVGAPVRDEATTEDGLQPAHAVLSAQVVGSAATPSPSTVSAPWTDDVTVAMVVPPNGAEDTTTVGDVVAAVNGPVADFWSGQSGGAIRFHSATPTGTTTWVHTAAGCDAPVDLWHEVESAVGFTAGAGKHLLLYLAVDPEDPGDCADGLAQVSATAGSPGAGYSYVTAVLPSLIAHELGHNLGLHHSSEEQCTPQGVCRRLSYADLYDVMGASWERLGTLNVVQQQALGLLPPSAVQQFRLGDCATAACGVLLAPVSSTGGTRAVRLVGRHATYLLEYRPAAGQDAWLADPSADSWGLAPGVLLRRVDSGGDDGSLLYDGTPSPPGTWDDDLVTPLPSGGQDIAIGGGDFTLEIPSEGPAGAQVAVEPRATSNTWQMTEPYYQQLLPASSSLGPPTSPLMGGLPNGGSWGAYEDGAVFVRPGGSPVVVHQPLLDAYLAAGGVGALGYPTASDGPTSTGDGAVLPLPGAAVYWSPATGAHLVRGALLQHYRELGAQAGPLGYPTGDDAAVPGGFTTAFARGALFWSAGTGAHMLRGAILDRYVAAGGSKVLGFPTADDGPTSANNGAWAPVQGGAVYWSAATGAHVVRGALLARWWQLGGIGGPLGYPTGDDAAVPGGFTTAFAGGALFWSAGTGAHMLRGAILSRYATLGGPATMGFPVGDDGPTTTAGGAAATFTGGSLSATAATPGGAIYWSPATGAHGVWGDIWHHWLAAGAQASPYGYPVADQTVDGTGTQVADFQHGRLSQPAAGAVQG